MFSSKVASESLTSSVPEPHMVVLMRYQLRLWKGKKNAALTLPYGFDSAKFHTGTGNRYILMRISPRIQNYATLCGSDPVTLLISFQMLQAD
jgi:hypothetical protein